MKDNKALYAGWLVLLVIGILAGLLTTYKVYTVGHVMYGVNDILFWTLPLASYIFFALTSTGLALVASGPLVFGTKKYNPIAKRAVFMAIAAIVAAFISLILELVTPWNMLSYITTPNPTSTLWWMAVLYGFYMIFLLATFLKIHTGQPSKTPALFMFLFAIAATPTLGATIGLIESRSAFFGEFMPVFFILTSILSGLAAIILVSQVYNHFTDKGAKGSNTQLFDELGKVFGLVIGIVMFFFIWRTIVGLYASAPGFIVVDYIVRSFPYHFELWLGLVVPFILMVVPSLRAKTSSLVAASALVLLGMFSSRMELLLEGQATPLGPRAVGMPEFVTYFPNMWEWLVVVFSLSVMLLLYTLGEQYLKLEENAR